ncbi:charged multivesicular body protein 1b [Anaeramoeba ignava]|uniref:Charged multivesicular body protein 1b n=1 Tax=Anaeramoeba ignava TaxID=1746090 RepID=A0A9Q0RDC0_ANAIG|nr:charged multivesicular body protein 1b [Anaeramoeba ignava]|eukprot:Anaeramoba_ignava/a610785_100.p1 GENE.a610785_100~~a610785_100.p1  ORF type:complete len:194 (+),score=79.92 a610785_100:33-614(+)
MENQLFQLKFTSRQLQRSSKKCEKDQKKQLSFLKKAIAKGNIEGARIYAQNSIRQKNQAMNYLRLASRIDGVAARVETAVRMGQLSKSMRGVVSSMGKSMEAMDLTKMTSVMDQFEKQFGDLDVMTETMSESMDSTNAMTTPTDEVDILIKQVADEHGIQIGTQLETSPLDNQKQEVKEDDLTARLQKLRGQN